MRWTTGLGIAIGGTSGAIAALMGTPKAPPVAPQARSSAAPTPKASAAPNTASVTITSGAPLAFSSGAPLAFTSAAPVTIASGAPATSASAASRTAAVNAPPTLSLPGTREGLMKAMLFCDQKKDFDECTRAAMALDLGSTGPPDPQQARRFRRIALTHVVTQCEAGSPHACFVLAAKYRAGTELPASPNSARTLHERGLELCRLGRSAPECPSP